MSQISTLKCCRGKEQARYESFYDGSFGEYLLFRARTKSLEVKSRVSRWKNGGCKRCMLCDKGVDETGTLDAGMREVSVCKDWLEVVTKEIRVQE